MEYLLSKMSDTELTQWCEQTISDLIQLGLLHISNQNIYPMRSDDVVCEKFCLSSSLHRGYYYPSPVYDLIVGNTKRGKVVTHPKPNAKITHRYLYNSAEQLYQIESLNHRKISYVETLFRNTDEIIGVTVDCNGVLAAVSKENYQDDRIISFTILNCYNIGRGYECYNYQEEHYLYDDEGLCACRYITLSPQSKYLVNKLYEFERHAGYLTAYAEHLDENLTSSPRRYLITKERKA